MNKFLFPAVPFYWKYSKLLGRLSSGPVIWGVFGYTVFLNIVKVLFDSPTWLYVIFVAPSLSLSILGLILLAITGLRESKPGNWNYLISEAWNALSDADKADVKPVAKAVWKAHGTNEKLEQKFIKVCRELSEDNILNPPTADEQAEKLSASLDELSEALRLRREALQELTVAPTPVAK